MFYEIPNNEEEMQETLQHCRFCTMWDKADKVCRITGEKCEHDHEKCGLFDKNEDAEKGFRELCEEVTD